MAPIQQQAILIQNNMRDKNHLQRLMTDIINVYGKHIITEKRFVNMLEDYSVFEKDNAFRIILNAIVAGKYAQFSTIDILKILH